MTQHRPDEAWIIRAEWSNSGLLPDFACTRFELAILSPVVAS